MSYLKYLSNIKISSLSFFLAAFFAGGDQLKAMIASYPVDQDWGLFDSIVSAITMAGVISIFGILKKPEAFKAWFLGALLGGVIYSCLKFFYYPWTLLGIPVIIWWVWNTWCFWSYKYRRDRSIVESDTPL